MRVLWRKNEDKKKRLGELLLNAYFKPYGKRDTTNCLKMRSM